MLRPVVPRWAAVLCALSLLTAAGMLRSHAQNNIVQPGDPIIASSSNSPGSEGVANAIDGKETKYLNFDTKIGGGPSGFVVTPSVGVTVVTGMTLQSANDAPERDPKRVTLEGSNDDAVTAFGEGNWELITQQDNIPVFENRFETKTLSFANTKPYKHYRWTVHETATENSCCFQIAEVGLLGTLLPSDITQPGDAIIASSSNSPGSEGVANAIDGKETKYLNFDTKIGGGPSGFIVTPSVGLTRVTGMSIQSANDAPERDPRVVTLEGSNDPAIADFASGTWELITRLDNIPAFAGRFQTQFFPFSNDKPYRHYRWTVVETATENSCCMQVAEVELLGSALPPDVTQPGDPIIASSANSPGSEGVANAIDGKETKYLNFDTKIDGTPSGFIVTPSIGRTVVTGITLQSANDAPERDPKIITVEGSNDETADYTTGTWEQIVRLDNIPAFAQRFQNQTFVFSNQKPYRHYRFTVVETQTINSCCFQIAEVELLGTGAPQDVTQPGDPIIASSSNSPGSEGVANAIDGKETKYLNFDTKVDGGPSGFVVTPSVGPTTVIGLTMQSANDAPERDPNIVTLEGSNDAEITAFNSGTWELITRIDDVPEFTERFQTQEFYFNNTKSFRHYRFTVVETATLNTCCMQIAEVELLALVEGADCTKARFVTQPVDTPVLLGNQATFTTVVNGPWPLQWLRNGEPIPGATRTSFTTDPITVENSTNVYAVQIVGCEKSSDVLATVFTPSTTKSLGISFIGGGANGAPTSMNTNDIAGVHPQAYWNNANAGSGDLPDFNTDPPTDLVDSDNQPSTVTFNWATSATWGAGTGADSATGRMLNGLVLDNLGGDPATFTFSNVPAGNHTLLVYVVSPPLQFQNVSYKVTGTSEQTYYIRAMNSDEYNAAPGFYRGVSTAAASPTVANFVRFDGVSPAGGAGGTITLTVDMTTAGFDRGTGVNALQLVLNAPNPGAPPAITADPEPTVSAEAGAAQLSVTATGENLTYQWRKDGRTLPNGGNISGATTATLTISDFTEADEGIYSVAVFNPAGSIVSKNAALRLSEFDIEDRLVGYWKMNETSGTSAANSAAGGSPVAFTGSPSWASGKVANAVGLDGQTYGEAANYTKATTAISGSAWVRPAAGAAGNQVIFRNAFGDMVPRGGAVEGVRFGQFELRLVTDEAGALRPESAIQIGPNVSRVTSSATMSADAWHHVAFTADGAQQRLYLDGAEVGVIDYLANINQPDIPYITVGAQFNYTDPADLTSPAGPDPNSPNFFMGSIDELALWTRALTAQEVGLLYAAGNDGEEVTSIVIEGPPQAAAISVAKGDGGNIVITYEGTLQSADSITGPFTAVAGATSPFTTSATDATKFYIVVP